MIWFFERMPRFNDELEAMTELRASEPWIQKFDWRIDKEAHALCIDADLQVGGNLREVTVTYPPTFPYAPPSITPRGTTERWSGHQYGAGGELCIEHRADNWNSGVTAAEMLKSVYKLLASEGGVAAGGKPIIVPSAHQASLGQLMRLAIWRFVATSSAIDRLANCKKATAATFHVSSNTKSLAVILVTLSDTEGPEWTDPELPEGITRYNGHTGFAVSLGPDDPQVAKIPAAVKEGAQAIRRLLVGDRVTKFEGAETIVVSAGSAIQAYRIDAADDTVYEYGIVLPAPAKRLMDSNALLATKKIAVIGAGSVGSKVAVSLARAGARKFLLVDDDVLSPENMVRHDLNWESVGHHKVESLAEEIKLIMPSIEVDARPYKLGGQYSSRGLHAVLKALATCDMIIDATGNATAFNYASSVAADHAKPMAWARVFGGGYGGLIARSRPGLEPAPQQARDVIENWCSNPDFPPAPKEFVDYQAVGTGDQPMVADDADVTAIAAHFTRLIIDTLTAPETSSFDNSAYMIGLRKEWIFAAAFDTHPIDLGSPAVLSPEVELTEEQKESAGAALMAMIEAAGSKTS